MLSGYRTRAYPTAAQAAALRVWVGHQRFIYNAKVREAEYWRAFARRSLSLTGQAPLPGQAVPRDCPPYPLTFEWEGQQGLTREQLEAPHLQMPAKAYALGTLVLSQPLLRVTDPCYRFWRWGLRRLRAA